MVYLMLILSCTGIIFASKYRETFEEHFIFKLFGYWLTSIITLTIEGSPPLPLGTIIAFFILYNAKINRKAKQYAVISGFIGYILSLIVFVLL